MKRDFKRVMAIHDLSGLGRSSLMAVTPVLSVMGVQVCPVPTAVLSSQTSGFTDYTFVDLTDSLSLIHIYRHGQHISVPMIKLNSSMFTAVLAIIIMMLPANSISYDEFYHWDRYVLTMPVSRLSLIHI